eukprot:SAG25_NODE_667_length_6052_cov_7.366202_4_plen_167_part_00
MLMFVMHLASAVKKKVGDDFRARTPKFLARVVGCLAQAWHRDAIAGYFAILPFTDEYFVGLVPSSHKDRVAMSDADFTRKIYDVFKGERMVDSAPLCYKQLKKGHLYLFDAKLIHCGGPARDVEGVTIDGLGEFFFFFFFFFFFSFFLIAVPRRCQGDRPRPSFVL